MSIPNKPTKKVAAKILELLSFGLTIGKGHPEPGKMCVEAVVCFALGLPHGDEPPCVGSAVRDYKIRLNECDWPSNKDRAEGMKELAIAQLGSNTLDQLEFGKLMYLRGTQQILPFVWRKESEKLTSTGKKTEMLSWCDKMEAVTTFDEAKVVAKSAYASASASASAYASDYAADYAAYAAYAAYASAASAYASYRHEILKLTAQVGVDVLKEMKSPGCKWLNLIQEKNK